MPRLTLDDLAVHEVELPGGHVYTVNAATRSVVRKTRALDEKLEQLMGGDEDEFTDEQLDELVGLYGEILNIRLTGVDTAPRPATLVKKLWTGDKISIPQLERLITGINETDRPT
jgi:hypothetical protein